MVAYYVAEGETVTGPFVESQLVEMFKAGRLTAAAQVCVAGQEEWQPICTTVPGIAFFALPRKAMPEEPVRAPDPALATATDPVGLRIGFVAVLLFVFAVVCFFLWANAGSFTADTVIGQMFRGVPAILFLVASLFLGLLGTIVGVGASVKK